MSKKISDAIAPTKKEGKTQEGLKNYGRVEPFVPKPRINEWKDDGVDAAADRVVNNPTLAKLYENAPGTVARGLSRPPADKTLVDVKCSICGAEDKVESIFVSAAYRCNECFKPNRRRRS